MSMKWIAIGLSLCAAAQLALLIRIDVLRMPRVAVAVALVGFGLAAAFHGHERSQSGSSIQSRLDVLKVRQADLKFPTEGTAQGEPLSQPGLYLWRRATT